MRPSCVNFKTDGRKLLQAKGFVDIYVGLSKKYSKKTTAKKRKAMREQFKRDNNVLIIF